jgi:hypothetical protein
MMIGVNAFGGDQTLTDGQPITSQNLKNATPVATFTPEQFIRAADRYTQQQCKKGTVKVTSDGSKIVLAGVPLSDDDFAAEIVRQSRQHPIYCLEIIGPGSAVKRTSALLQKLKGTDVVNISWRPSK